MQFYKHGDQPNVLTRSTISDIVLSFQAQTNIHTQELPPPKNTHNFILEKTMIQEKSLNLRSASVFLKTIPIR